MARIKHVNCPTCGGTLGVGGMERLVKCRYCDNWSLVEGPDLVPEYYIKPGLEEKDARRVLQRFLTQSAFPDGLLKSSRFHSARLFFVPFYELSARRLGTMTHQEVQSKVPRMRADYVGAAGSSTGMTRSFRSYDYKEKKDTVDTRVVMGDVHRIEPATTHSEWALEEAELSSLRTDQEGVLVPMDRRAMEKKGRIYDATRNVDAILQAMTSGNLSSRLEDNTRMEEARVKKIFYPVWRVKYQHQGRLYGATIDGVTGKIMSARAPNDDRLRIFWILLSTAVVALVAGKGGRLAASALFLDKAGGAASGVPSIFFVEFSYVLLVLLLVGVAVGALIIGFGWDKFRYQSEVVVRGSSVRVISINRPETTRFDIVSRYAQRILSGLFDLEAGGRGSWWR
ncbi:MAG: hypothetical protein R6V10_15200 [bacterium]